MTTQARIAVVGAGAFGGWTALSLRRRGCEVVLIDAWGPGHARSSSGGATRVFRQSYVNPEMVRLAGRARELWVEEQERSGRRLFDPIGMIWLAQERSEVEQAVLTNLNTAGVPHEWLEADQAARAYPQIRTDDLEGAIVEPGAGVLRAREACLAVRDALVAEGGTYRESWVEPGAIRSGRMEELVLADGSRERADVFVFAVGPWQGSFLKRFHEWSMPVTRQEVFVFGTPPGDVRFGPSRLPVWAFHGAEFWYGVPGDGDVGGFKIADDTRGSQFDPTTGDRTPSAQGLENARSLLAKRFPGMADAPLIAASVCQYTEAIDGRFLADRLQGSTNAWIVTGGSGHGFKHGPAVGESVAALVLGDRTPESDQAFSTFSMMEGA
ncbi:NAD(P)/FAD-dependent oxidoreductase [Tautonia rosea]|uniref:NAD(P)/FAD-dependent oxidoreductase n=1 Tax=Tautonia rosea TaxID=2728037 RepID=UPI001475DBDC|nr:FAD-dependent oxidoreductase [Tautonia rosea]